MRALPRKLVKLLRDTESVKVVGSLNEDGSPHVVLKGSLTTIDGKTIVFSEGLEKSLSNKNLVRSIWFNKPVSINVSKAGVSYQVKATPYKCVITGKLFQKFLLRARAKRGSDADISTVWIVLPEEIRNESPLVRRRQEEKAHPYFDRHLDRESIKK